MLVFAVGVSAQKVQEPTGDLAKIGIVEHLGSNLPLDLQFTDESGRAVTLRDYFGKGKPVLLTLGYYGCPMLCNMVLNGVADGVKGLQWSPGDQFTMLTVSINPKETPELASAKKQNYLTYLGRPEAGSSWSFLVGHESQSKALAEAMGFIFVYDSTTGQYGHAACAYLLTEDGQIARYLYGIEFPTRDLKYGLLEASQGKIGSTVDRLLLYCYHYDPAAKGYVLFAQNVMKIGGGMTVIAVAALLIAMFSRERQVRRRAAPSITRTT
jgi:protein SCO1/2